MVLQVATIAILLCVCACNRTLVKADFVIPEQLKQIFDKCISETGTTLDEFNQNRDSEKSQCVLKCVATQKNIISKDGAFDGNLMVEDIKKYENLNLEDDQIACLKKITTITSCQDMKKVKDCMKL